MDTGARNIPVYSSSRISAVCTRTRIKMSQPRYEYVPPRRRNPTAPQLALTPTRPHIVPNLSSMPQSTKLPATARLSLPAIAMVHFYQEALLLSLHRRLVLLP